MTSTAGVAAAAVAAVGHLPLALPATAEPCDVNTAAAAMRTVAADVVAADVDVVAAVVVAVVK